MIHLVYVSDAIASGKALEELSDRDRALPGEGKLSQAELLTLIRKTGFQGPLSMEVFHPQLLDLYLVAREAFGQAK